MMDGYLTLTAEAVEHLKKPFAAQFHDFTQGFVYLAERAVCERIEQVDPAWSFEIVDVSHYPGRNRVNVRARMTILGVSREGIGSGNYLDTPVKEYKTKELKQNDLGQQMMNYSESEKGAATDALRRCARLFGVGRYLLDTPQNVNDERSLAAWLNTIDQTPAPKPAPSPSKRPARKVIELPPQDKRVDPQGVEEGAKKTVSIVKRITKAEAPKLWFRTSELDGSLLVKAYSRQPFIDKFYCTEIDWLDVDIAEDMQFSAEIVMGKYGWWEFNLASLPEFNPEFEAATGTQSAMPGMPKPQWDGDVVL